MTEAARNAGVLGLGVAVPERRLTNADLEQMVDTSDEWIRSRTGIRERRIADDDTTTADLAAEAGRRALADADVAPGELDVIMVATATPEMIFPATACVVQDAIGAADAAAWDLSAACTGFLYGVTSASQHVMTGLHDHILVIGAETLSRIVDWSDRSTCVLFGDGAGAVVIGPADSAGFETASLGAMGAGAELLSLPAGGSRQPATHETVDAGLHYIHMNGSEVFRHATRIMSEASREALDKADLDLADVDWLVPHQANIRIIEAVARQVGISMDRVIANIERFGNTSSASIPLALAEARRQGDLGRGDVLLLAAFGGGLTYGAAILRWLG